MRRHSLAGPLLLIGIGALFLAHNVIPDLPLLDYLALYWPLLLVLWGVLRLLELVVVSFRGLPVPKYGLHGGEWMLVIFFSLFGLGLHAARGFTSWLPRDGIEWSRWELFGESYNYPVSADVTTTSTPRVVLEGFRGTARVTGVEGNSVKVSGNMVIRSMDQATADRVSKDVKLDVTNEAGQVIIRQIGSGRDVSRFNPRQDRFSSGIGSNIDIQVPKGATVVMRGNDSDVDVRSVVGNVEVNAMRTDLRLEEIGGDVRADLNGSNAVHVVKVKGSVEMKGNGHEIDLEDISGPVTLAGQWGPARYHGLAQPVRLSTGYTTFTAQAIPGDARSDFGDLSASGIKGPVRVDSTNKDVTLADVTGPVAVTIQRGDIHLTANSPLGDTTLRTQAGNVEITLPENAKFNLNAVTERGDAFNGYGSVVSHDTHNRGARLGSTGGGPAIEVHVQRGDISVHSGAPGDVTSIKKPQPLTPPTQLRDQ